MTGIAVTVLTGVAVTTWNESYELLGSAPDNAVVFGDGLAMGPATGIAVAVGLAVTAFGVAWPRWLVARGWLALRGRLPFRLMSFLDDAHQRGVLRQAGPFYQFRHIELQHHLARRFAASAPGQPGPGSVGPQGAGTGPPRRRSLRWRLPLPARKPARVREWSRWSRTWPLVTASRLWRARIAHPPDHRLM